MFESNPLIKVRWKDHGSIIMSNLLKLLQEDEEFADVRVRHAARTVKAHRTMLAANSAMFRAYLTSAGPLAGAAAGAGAVTALELGSVPCLESLLQAKGADAVLSELEQIVHLVYCGWVDLREHHIGSLLETARCLQFGDVCQVLQRTMQARAGTVQQQVQHVPPPPPPPTLTPTLPLPPPPPAHAHPAIPVSGPESLEHHLSVSELTMRDLHEAMLSHESSLPWSPEIAELHPMPVEQRPDPPAPPAPPPPAPPAPAVSLSQLLSSPSDSGLRHEDAAGLTAASLCEVVFQPTTCTTTAPLSHQTPLTVVSAASDGPTLGGAAGPAAQEGGHTGHQQQQRPGDGQTRPAGPQDSAPLLRVRTQFELHCPWGVDMEQAGRKRPDHGWPGILMPAPPPPPARPPAPPAAAAAAAAAAADPPLSAGTGAGGLVAEEEQAIIDHCGLPPSTPDTLERFDENFSGLTEEEKSPMPPKAARVRRYRRRATMRARIRKVPALISLDQSCVCQVCGRDLGRMAALQRHIATEHADRPAVVTSGAGAGAGAGEERLPASTVDTSAIADPGDTCAGLMSFRTRLTAAAEAAAAEVAALAEVVESSERLASAGGRAARVDSTRTAPPGGEDDEPADTAGKAAQEPRGPSEPWLAVETVLDTEHADDDSDCDDPAPADVQPGDETPPLVIAERQGERGSTVRVQLQRLPDSEQPAPAADRTAAAKSLRKHSAALACSHCPLQFRQAAALYRHMARVHPTQPSRLTKCLMCPYQSPRPSTIRRHMRDVHGQDTQGRQLPRNLLCGQCDYATCSELKLKQHERRKHTVDKEFKCSECSYSSVDKQALTKHYRIMHTEDRPYRCEICDFRSATLSRISRHRRSHTQERPHECTMCGYRYADLRRLREHMQAVHEPAGGDGEGSSFFQCKFCVRVFARRDNMQQHVRKIHSSKARLDSF